MYLVTVSVSDAAQDYVAGKLDLNGLQDALVEASLSGDESDLTLDVELMVAETVRGDRSEHNLRGALKALLPAFSTAGTPAVN